MDTTDGFECLCQDKDVSKQPDNVNEQAGAVTTTQKQVNDEIERQQNDTSEPQDLSRNEGQAFARNGRVQKSNRQKGKTYKVHEDLNFLGLMHDILPITADEWNRVVEEHNSSEPPPGEEYNQNAESIQKRWRSLYLKRAPTGDPKCPENVRLAKKVKVMITQKLEVCTGEI